MHASRCQEHGSLVHDLALGRLGDAEAERAETTRRTCPSCNAWWSQHLENQQAIAVDTAVREGLAAFRAPSHGRQRQWWAVAAAVILALATGMLWHLGSSPVGVETQALFDTPKPVLQPEVSTISAFDFEPATAAETDIEFVGQRSPEKAAGNQPATGAIFTGGFESGGFGDWVPTT